MAEAENEYLLNRKEAVEQATKYLSPQIALLEDLVNYGSHLILRAYSSSKKETTDVVVCGVLLKQIVCMLDAVQILLQAGTVHPAFLPSRAAFEALLYLEFILEQDSLTRARAYTVANYREEREWWLKIKPGTPQAASFDQQMASINVDVLKDRPELATERDARLIAIDAHLAIPELKPLNDMFDAARKKAKRDPEWYKIFGPVSIKALAATLGRESEYITFYAKGSKVTHTASIRDHFTNKAGIGQLRHIRELNDTRTLITFTVGHVIKAYRRVLTFYRPAEIPQFDKRYAEDWRAPFLNAPAIKTE